MNRNTFAGPHCSEGSVNGDQPPPNLGLNCCGQSVTRKKKMGQWKQNPTWTVPVINRCATILSVKSYIPEKTISMFNIRVAVPSPDMLQFRPETCLQSMWKIRKNVVLSRMFSRLWVCFAESFHNNLLYPWQQIIMTTDSSNVPVLLHNSMGPFALFPLIF